MKTLNKKLFFVLTILIVLGSLVVLFVYKYRQIENQAEISVDQKQELDEQLENMPESKQNSASAPISATSTFKTYRNEEWGFEFQYPKEWILKENTFRSYYSKFNLEIFVQIGEQFDSTFLVNIVLPEFTERSFRGLEKTTSEITVAGIQGIKYLYKYQGFFHTAVILPFRELRIILATGDGSKQYLDEFNQIITSFKFLK